MVTVDVEIMSRSSAPHASVAWARRGRSKGRAMGLLGATRSVLHFTHPSRLELPWRWCHPLFIYLIAGCSVSFGEVFGISPSFHRFSVGIRAQWPGSWTS